MEIIETRRQLQQYLSPRSNIGIVPTMGNLHEGHLNLVKLTRPHCDTLVTSIFVNRLQFGPAEDFDLYPRTLDADLSALKQAAVEVVFIPTQAEMYPQRQTVTVLPPPIGDELEGAYRPGFFRGVCTIVLKLFNLTTPVIAAFGKKDRQQLAVIQAMVNDLNLSTKILAGETVRASDGLALSSRNNYLSPAERAEAPQLYKTLKKIAATLQEQKAVWHKKQLDTLTKTAQKELSERGWETDYIEVRESGTLHSFRPEIDVHLGNLVILGAATLGKTRLIDNIDT